MNDAATGVSVVRVTDEHLAALAGFYRQVWDPDATANRVRAARAAAAERNPVTPGEPPPTWAVLRDGEAVGHVTTIPFRLWLGGRDLGAYWVKGLWVLPAYQRGAVGFLLLRAAAAALERSLALVHDPAAVRLFRAVGFTDLGPLPNTLRILRARRVMTRLDLAAVGLGAAHPLLRAAWQTARATASVSGPATDGLFAAWALAAGGLGGRARIEVRDQLDRTALDELWASARGAIGAGAVRDSRPLAPRYEGAGPYAFVHAWRRDRLAGLAVVRRPREEGDPRLRGVRVATLTDLVHHPTDRPAALSLLRGAEQAARAMDADALLCGASADGTRRAARRRAYLPLPGNLHVVTRISGDAAAAAPTFLGDWWITRGDSEADGSF